MSAGDIVLEAARIAADLLLALLPAEDAKKLIDEAAVKRANAAADAAEAIKFGKLADDLADLDDPAYDADDPTNPGK